MMILQILAIVALEGKAAVFPPVILAAEAEDKDDLSVELKKLPQVEAEDRLNKAGYFKSQLKPSNQTVYFSPTLYPKASIDRYLSSLSKLSQAVGRDGTLDSSDKELRKWVQGMFNVARPEYQAVQDTEFQVNASQDLEISDGTRSIKVSVANPSRPDRSKLFAHPLALREKNQGATGDVYKEQFTRSFLGNQFSCFLLEPKNTRPPEKLRALSQASGLLAEMYAEFHQEVAKLQKDLFLDLARKGLATSLEGESENSSGLSQAQIEGWARNYSSMGFDSENDARTFLGKAKITGKTQNIMFFAGHPGGKGSIGFGLQSP